VAFNLREIFKALADAQADYVLVGGLAVILHGHLRATRDIDLVVGLAPANCAAALGALSGIGLRPRLPVSLADFADEATRTDWIERRHMQVFQLWDPANPERSVDLFVREPFAISEMLAEAVIKDLDGVPIRIASIRHLIAMKQAAGRRHDLDDIEALRQIATETGQPDGSNT
jgi:predicted nucleotidyltransferase